MKIVILHETLTEHDAIGNDIQGMHELLSSIYDCHIYAKYRLNPHVSYLDKEQLETLCANQETVLIYHHSIYWEEGYQILKKSCGRVIFRYHNITPERYFEKYNPDYYKLCRRGRDQTLQFQREFPDAYWIVDSEYNAQDLTEVQRERIGICPPFHRIEQWSSGIPDERILQGLLESDTYNLLFVGRIVPNKGYLKLLEIVRYYREIYDDPIKIRLIGKCDNSLADYNDEINNYLENHELGSQVEMIGEINDQTLMSYYMGSDALLCCSEHEGFCVPVIESQYFGLPVVALRSSAVTDTLGEKQLIFDDDSYLFAAALHVLRKHPAYQKMLRKWGRENFQKRFAMMVIKERFLAEFRKGCE